eukprot:PhM_4_TR3288/c0_g1_i2/m.2306
MGNQQVNPAQGAAVGAIGGAAAVLTGGLATPIVLSVAAAAGAFGGMTIANVRNIAHSHVVIHKRKHHRHHHHHHHIEANKGTGTDGDVLVAEEENKTVDPENNAQEGKLSIEQK